MATHYHESRMRCAIRVRYLAVLANVGKHGPYFHRTRYRVAGMALVQAGVMHRYRKVSPIFMISITVTCLIYK